MTKPGFTWQSPLKPVKWKDLPHPPYSADIAPSDYHLFRSMAHGLADQQLHSNDHIKEWLDSWIHSRHEQFYRNGIRVLPERWEKVIAGDGQYFQRIICKHVFIIKLQQEFIFAHHTSIANESSKSTFFLNIPLCGICKVQTQINKTGKAPND